MFEIKPAECWTGLGAFIAPPPPGHQCWCTDPIKLPIGGPGSVNWCLGVIKTVWSRHRSDLLCGAAQQRLQPCTSVPRTSAVSSGWWRFVCQLEPPCNIMLTAGPPLPPSTGRGSLCEFKPVQPACRPAGLPDSGQFCLYWIYYV